MALPLALGAVLACWAPSRAAGEVRRRPEPVDAALRRLSSPDAAEQAWGAYLAAQDRVVEALPLVLSRLREQAALPEERRSFLLGAALLDAIVRLDLDVDVDDLLPHAHGRLLPAVVAHLARRPERRGAGCLRLFESLPAGEREWRALGNALASVRTPGFVSSLLRDLELRLVVRVWTRLPPNVRTPQGSVPG